MKLYLFEHCPFCARVRLAFGLKQIPYDAEIVMDDDAETPTRLVGRKSVPILRRQDGSHMAESLDIVQYLDTISVPMFDGPHDERLDAWGEEAWSLALKLFIPRFVEADFAEIATPEARDHFRSREEAALGDLASLHEATLTLVEAMKPRLAALDAILETANGTGISDLKLWPILRSLSIVAPLPFPRHVRRYVDELSRRSGVPTLFHQAR